MLYWLSLKSANNFPRYFERWYVDVLVLDIIGLIGRLATKNLIPTFGKEEPKEGINNIEQSTED